MFDAATGEHIYLSTACLHDQHERCPLVCQWCGDDCLCLCHRSKERAVTEPVDNPATPDVDLDPDGEPGTVAAPELGQAGEAEPLPDGDADNDDAQADVDEDDEDLADGDPENVDDTEDDEVLLGGPVEDEV